MNATQIKFNWRQPSPMMQLITIISSLEGNTMNWEDAIITDRKYAAHAAEHSEQLSALLPYLEKGIWVMPNIGDEVGVGRRPQDGLLCREDCDQC